MTKQEPDKGNRLIVSYCYGGTVLYEPREVLAHRVLPDYEAVLIIDGFPTYETNAGSCRLEPGSILLARPGTTEAYRWDTERRTRHAYLHFDLESVPEDWPAAEEWPAWQIRPPDITAQLLRHMIERAVSHPDWPAVKPGTGDNRIMEAFLHLYINGAGAMDAVMPGVLSEPVRRAVKFMRERLDSPAFEPFSLHDLAEATCVTSKHLCRAFQSEFGISPMKACRLMQFQLAIPLLARSNLSIKAIAERCGFLDQLHFSRSFRQALNMSPTQVRTAMMRGEPPPPNPLPPALMPRLYW